jgi:MFS family permease
MIDAPAIGSISNSKMKYREKDEMLWKQMISLTLLYASVIIGWIAYYNYQPILLQTYDFTHLTLFLFISQGIILVVTPLIAGKLGDKYRFTAGKRLPIISAGVSFAAMIFMATAFTLFSEPGPIFRWILPGLIVVWLFSMALFTSPALSTIEVFVPIRKLPTAMALLTIVYGLLYAVEPVIVDLINFLGATLTFVVGGVAVFLSGLLMRKNTTYIVDKPMVKDHRKSDYTYALSLGMALGAATTILFNIFPLWFTERSFTIFGLGDSKIVCLVLALVAAISLPISKIVESRSVFKSVLISILGTLLVSFGLYFIENSAITFILLLLFAVFYAVMSVSFLPTALTIVNDKNKVFGVGVFFAGFEIPNGILEAFMKATGIF